MRDSSSAGHRQRRTVNRRWHLMFVHARIVILLVAAGNVLVPCASSTAGEGPAYAIVVSEETMADPAWAAVVVALEAKHRGQGTRVIQWRDAVGESSKALADEMPRYACFVARPEEAERRFVAEVHTLSRSLDDDPYGDVLWGILTGLDAANAQAIAMHSEPLVVKHVTSGTEIAMDRVVEGEWYSEVQKNRMVRKEFGEEPEALQGPDDTTKTFVELLSAGKTDLLVTSGHATERGWQIGFSYPNGQLRSANGLVFGVDTAGNKMLVGSTNPKVWLPVGNCLAGHIDGRDALALAFMNGCQVHQMIGYTVPTWFGYAGWGCLDFFLEQPGRFTLCQAFHANNHALIHRLETKADPRGERGLRFDRDVVAFYGDPAWEARMADGKKQFSQTLTEQDGVFTLDVSPLDAARSYAPVNTNGSQRGGRPIVHYLPRRLGTVEIIEGSQWNPVVTDTFVLVPLPPPTSTESIRVSFRPVP